MEPLQSPSDDDAAPNTRARQDTRSCHAHPPSTGSRYAAAARSASPDRPHLNRSPLRLAARRRGKRRRKLLRLRHRAHALPASTRRCLQHHRISNTRGDTNRLRNIRQSRYTSRNPRHLRRIRRLPSPGLRPQHPKIKLRVTDFGIGGLAAAPVLERSRSSSSLEGDLSAVLTGAYSPLYASPQQMRGAKPDPRDDVYALGVIWYQLLTADLTNPAPTGRRWVDELRQQGTTDAALDLLSSCFESNPAHRPTMPSCSPRGSRRSRRRVRKRTERPGPQCRSSKRSNRQLSSCYPAKNVSASGSGAAVDRAPGRSGRTGAPRHVRHPQRWLSRLARRRALGLFALLGIIIYVATDNGTVKITGTDDRMRVPSTGATFESRIWASRSRSERARTTCSCSATA